MQGKMSSDGEGFVEACSSMAKPTGNTEETTTVTGDAYMCKAVLQNDLLQDPDEGVNYFKNTLNEEVL